MPFTLAHPAIVIPLQHLRLRLSLTALITGSLVPDFEFFFRMREVNNIGHHWYGILIFDLPVALLVCFLFHNLLRNTLVLQLPARYQGRFIQVLNFNWNRYAAENRWRVIISLMIGVISHIFLDGFTHHDGLFVTMIPGLAANVHLMDQTVPVYFLLQLLFSVIGLWMLYRMITALPVQQLNNRAGRKNKYYWPAIFITCLVLVTARLLIRPDLNSFWGVFMAVMGGICYAWLLVSILYKNKLQKI